MFKSTAKTVTYVPFSISATPWSLDLFWFFLELKAITSHCTMFFFVTNLDLIPLWKGWLVLVEILLEQGVADWRSFKNLGFTVDSWPFPAMVFPDFLLRLPSVPDKRPGYGFQPLGPSCWFFFLGSKCGQAFTNPNQTESNNYWRSLKFRWFWIWRAKSLGVMLFLRPAIASTTSVMLRLHFPKQSGCRCASSGCRASEFVSLWCDVCVFSNLKPY